MGVASAERAGRVVEGIAILRKLWSPGVVRHEGKYHHFEDVDLHPKPIQSPMPILLAVNPKPGTIEDQAMERILRRVAAHADGWQTDSTRWRLSASVSPRSATMRRRSAAIRQISMARCT